MTNIKQLIALQKNLSQALLNLNNLGNVTNKCCWKIEIEDLLNDISEAINYERSKEE